MSVSIAKLDGVRAVKVSLNEGRAVVELSPGNTVTLAEIRERVQRNGFTPKGAMVMVRARVTAADGKLRLEVPETKETFAIATTSLPEKLAELEKRVGNIVTVKGLVAAPQEKAAAAIEVTDVTAEGARP